MKRMTRLLISLFILALLGACATPRLIPLNTTNADELLKRLGKPTETMPNPAGGEYWDYVYGPAGFETWRFGIDSGRVVRSSEQLLTHARLYQVMAGKSTEKEVHALLGKPSEITRYANHSAWSWRVNLQPTLGHFAVQFDRNGIAQGTLIVTDFQADGDRGDP